MSRAKHHKAGGSLVGTLASRIAWVTGAGTGIGEAAAIALAREGAVVVLTGRRKEPLQAAAEKIAEAGGRASVKPADLTSASAVQEVADTIKSEQGRLDIVVNNAGMNVTNRSWRQLDMAGADAVIAGNLTSAFYVVQAALPSCGRSGTACSSTPRRGRDASLAPCRARPTRRPSTAWWP
jgi:NAD(P)-dependent dehydrogenase (short-subunit alcohol dehydrogenase family)